jgi:pantetheine-phosphate adenylyltransferase
MNDVLGVTTLLMPARPELATTSSTAVRALRAAGSVCNTDPGGLGSC